MLKKMIAGCMPLLFTLLFTFNSASAVSISLGDYEVLPGQDFDVDVLIDTEGDPTLVAGFEFDIDYNPAIITPTNLVNGAFLPMPYWDTITPFPLPGQIDLTYPEIEFYNFCAAPGLGGNGFEVLATITFHADNAGFSVLDLNDVNLRDPLTNPIACTLTDGSVNVVPEPSSLILLFAALPFLICLSKKKFL